jgi:DNA-binding LacI/PurR family transcriptional regulator
MKPVKRTRKYPSKKTTQPAETKQRPATLVDVARLAGVVPMTASRAINGSGYASEEVRERVLKVARQLHYRPNVLARQLKGQRLNAVGILLPDIANPFSSELLRGIKEVLVKAGYTAFVATADRSIDQERSALQAFVDHRIDGLLVATRGTQLGDEALREITRRGVPLVTIGRPVKIPAVDWITADHWRGAYDVVSHLIQLGHKRIGFIGLSEGPDRSPRRYEGYCAALRDAGLGVVAEYAVGSVVAPAFATEQDGYEGMMTLAKLKRPPTAVFARNDFAAIGALRAAHTLGLKIPQQMAIAGFDDIPVATYTVPPLTTVRQPIAEQGREAAKLLIGRIEKTQPGKAKHICMDCRLIVRESTDPKAVHTHERV